jgi:FkbM family methyltransferase
VSDKESSIPFYIYSHKNYGVGRIFDDHEDNTVKSIMINANTLDYYADKFGVPDLIKMDIEGAEALALLGGQDLFSKPNAPVLFIEFSSG